MTLESIFDLVKKIIDISFVWLIFYFILKNIRNNVKLTLLFKGVAFVLILKLVSDWLGLNTVGLLLQYVLEQLGRTHLLGRHKVLTVDEREHLVYEIIQAMDYLRKSRIGALIVLERDVSLANYIEKAKKIYADLSSDLLEAIFFPNNPLHDGGVIIQGDRITCAGAVFPTSNNAKANKRLGTRHRAALGIAEETDAISLVVSEETGRISVAVKGELFYNLSLDDVRMMLIDELRPKQDSEYEETEEEEIYEENK